MGTYGLVTGEWALVASEGAFALGSLTVTARLAQIRAVLRGRTATGVAVPTWLLLAASNAAWAVTGALRGNGFFSWSAAAGAAASPAVVAACAAVSHHRS